MNEIWTIYEQSNITISGGKFTMKNSWGVMISTCFLLLSQVGLLIVMIIKLIEYLGA